MKTVVHQFFVGDGEDPYIIAGFLVDDFFKTELGQWITLTALNTEISVHQTWPEAYIAPYKCEIIADLDEKDYTIFVLKWKK